MAASPSGDLGPALALSGSLSSTEAEPGWPLRAAPGIAEEFRRQEAVPNFAWTRASQGAPGGLVKVQAGSPHPRRNGFCWSGVGPDTHPR